MSIFEVKNGNLVRKDAATAAELAYSNTTSGLSASTVQEAIDELDDTLDTLGGEVMPSGGSAGQVLKKDSGTDYDADWGDIDASEVGYDNTTSGLTADDVQEAIDELAGSVGTLGTDKQPKTLATSITIDGTPETTVEGALGGLNEAVKKRMTYADNGVLGAHNLLPNEAKTQTLNDVTFTVNADGSISTSGTASARIDLFLSKNLPKFAQDVKLTGCAEGGSGSTFRLQFLTSDSAIVRSDDGGGVTITTADTASYNAPFWCRLVVYSGANMNGKTFKPMLRLASDTDATYQPYAMTNQELTKKITYNKGDTVSLASCCAYGFVTSGKKQLTLFLPLMRPVNGTPSLSITSLQARGDNEYIVNGADMTDTSLYNAGAVHLRENGVDISYTKKDNTEWNVTKNNSPVVFFISAGTMTIS